MSSAALKRLANSILKDLEETANKAENDARKQLEDQPGQILIINKTRFSMTLINLVPELAGDDGKAARNDIWDAYSKKLTGLKSQVPPDRLAEMMELYGPQGQKIPGIRANDYVFFIKTYGSAKRAKGVILQKVVKDVLKTHEKKFSEENLARLGGADNKTGSQLGHAEEGLGYAASSLRVARAQKMLQSSSIAKKEKIADIITDFENTIGLTIDHSQIISAQGLKKDYTPILSWQKAVSNNTLAKLESQAIRSFKEKLKDIGTLESSTKLVNAIGMVMLDALAPEKASNVRVTGKRKKVVKEESRGEVEGKFKGKRKTRAVRDNTVPKSVAPKKKRNRGPSSTPLALLGIFNSELPRTLQKNMRDPALNYQSGRFANSVRVMDVNTTSKGYPSFGFSYQKDPYQVFEMGVGREPWATPDRDPRKLIDNSMREIAAKYAVGRFFTRRL
jgi:hypothetical protein